MYVNSINDFKFLRGDRILILDIAEYLQKECDSVGLQQFSKSFEMEKHYKLGKMGTANFSFGVFFCQKNRQRIPKAVAHVDLDELAASLFGKLKSFFGQFTGIRAYLPVSQDLIQIIGSEFGPQAGVICIFCPQNDCHNEFLVKRYAVQYNKTGHWNFSNFRKHIITKHPNLNDST